MEGPPALFKKGYLVPSPRSMEVRWCLYCCQLGRGFRIYGLFANGIRCSGLTINACPRE